MLKQKYNINEKRKITMSYLNFVLPGGLVGTDALRTNIGEIAQKNGYSVEGNFFSKLRRIFEVYGSKHNLLKIQKQLKTTGLPEGTLHDEENLPAKTATFLNSLPKEIQMALHINWQKYAPAKKVPETAEVLEIIMRYQPS